MMHHAHLQHRAASGQLVAAGGALEAVHSSGTPVHNIPVTEGALCGF